MSSNNKGKIEIQSKQGLYIPPKYHQSPTVLNTQKAPLKDVSNIKLNGFNQNTQTRQPLSSISNKFIGNIKTFQNSSLHVNPRMNITPTECIKKMTKPRYGIDFNHLNSKRHMQNVHKQHSCTFNSAFNNNHFNFNFTNSQNKFR